MSKPTKAVPAAVASPPRPVPGAGGSARLIHCSGSVKVTSRHLEQVAVLYVRQSTPQQVVLNRESLDRQYALADFAVALGWPRDRVIVIDDDLGHSGASTDGRAGFQRMLTEVTLHHVGLVLALEASRLARSSMDWHQLFELCGAVGTLLADQDGVYDANDPNDRLILGLKGIMSEMELLTMRARLDRGAFNKAQRGELHYHLPMGYVKTPSGDVVLDPDEQVRDVIRLIFAKFEELGTASGVFRYLARNKIRIGFRPHRGPDQGQLVWREPCRTTILNTLYHPIYAGAYVYGRCSTDPHRKVRGRNVCTRPSRNMDDWKILILDKLPSYISWDQFLRNVARLKQNRAKWESPGAVRHGPSLLGGIVFCGHCGARFRVTYQGAKAGHPSRPYYWCQRRRWDPTAERCPSVGAEALDELVGQQILKVLEPASLELSLKAAEHVQSERERLHRQWKQQLERARYEADRAQRQYNAVEPENRLVARSLEQRWEETLHRERELKEEYERFCRDTPHQLTAEERDRISRLSTDIPALWHAPETDAADRQTLVRHFLEKVVATVQGDAEIVDVTLHWVGGFVSQHQIKRRLGRYEQLEHFQELKRRMIELRDDEKSYPEIAATLNREGFRTCYGLEFDLPHVAQFFSRHGLRVPNRGRFLTEDTLSTDEWTLPGLARHLGMSSSTLRHWCTQGWVLWRQLPGYKGRWILWADANELKRLTKLRDYPRHAGPKPPYPAKLTTPKRPATAAKKR